MTDGTIEQRDGRVSFRYQRELTHPIERVWRAITDADELAHWLGTKPELELRVGGLYVLIHTSPDGTQSQRVEDRVVRLEPPHVFAHTFWAELNPSALVTWTLTPTGTGTRLDLTHELDITDMQAVAGQESIVTMMSRNASGWHILLDRLSAEIDGEDVDQAWPKGTQQALQERYASLLDS